MTFPDFGFEPTTPSFDSGIPEIGADYDFDDTVKQMSRSLIETGTTGNPAVDLDAVAMARNQLTPMEKLMDSIKNEQIPKLQQARLEQMKVASGEAEMSPGQALAAAILQIAPIFIGYAAKGNAGGKVGAESGALGQGILIKGVEDDATKKQKRALLEAKDLSEKEKALGDEYRSLQKTQFTQDFQAEQKGLDRSNRLDAAGRSKSDINFSMPDPGMREGVENLLNLKDQAAEIKQYIEENFTGENSEGGLTDVWGRKLSAFAGTSEEATKAKQLESMVKEYSRYVALDINKGALTDRDVDEAKAISTGGDNSTVQQIYDIMTRHESSIERRRQNKIEAGRQSGKNVTGYETGGYPTKVNQEPLQTPQVSKTLVNQYRSLLAQKDVGALSAFLKGLDPTDRQAILGSQ